MSYASNTEALIDGCDVAVGVWLPSGSLIIKGRKFLDDRTGGPVAITHIPCRDFDQAKAYQLAFGDPNYDNENTSADGLKIGPAAMHDLEHLEMLTRARDDIALYGQHIIGVEEGLVLLHYRQPPARLARTVADRAQAQGAGRCRRPK